MTQTILTINGSKIESELQRLKRLRSQYYNELVQDIKIHKIAINSCINSYNVTVKNIDTKINSLLAMEQKNENKPKRNKK